MKKITDDVLIFTGFSTKELEELRNVDVGQCIEKAAVVISGEYIDELNDNKTALVASANQEIILNNERYRDKYISYMDKGRIIENFYYGDNLISVGIHNRRKLV
jgi:anaerobic ribonucleoside-triphosphate reductase activating protein